MAELGCVHVSTWGANLNPIKGPTRQTEILEASSTMPSIPKPHDLLLLITSVNDPSLI